MKVKLYPALAAIAIVAISLFFACRKSDLQKKPAENFDVAAAKEWWYGTFRKTAEYKKTDWTSPLAPPETFSTKKYPSWKRAISYKRGTIQIIELPLVYEANSILLPGMQGLNGTKEGERIARSAIHKLVIIKQQNGTVSVRTVTIVPMPEYAKAHHYDMSHITMEKLPTDFSGYLMVGSWDASEKNIIKMGGGKPARKVKLRKTAPLTRNGLNFSTEVEVCGWEEVPHMVWVCVVVPTGDDLADEETCQENGEWVQQGTVTEWVCREETNDPENPGDSEEVNLCMNTGMTEEECICIFYANLCDPGDGGGGENPPPLLINDVNDPCIKNSVNNAISSDCRNEITAFINNAFGTNETYHLYFYDNTLTGDLADADAKTVTVPLTGLNETKTSITFNNAQLNGSSKEYIVATILHEAIHAWIDYKWPVQMDNAHQHNMMASTYRFNLMFEALKEMCPNLSDQDAIDLVWGGLGDTSLFEAKSSIEKERITERNKDFKQRRNNTGTPC